MADSPANSVPMGIKETVEALRVWAEAHLKRDLIQAHQVLALISDWERLCVISSPEARMKRGMDAVENALWQLPPPSYFCDECGNGYLTHPGICPVCRLRPEKTNTAAMTPEEYAAFTGKMSYPAGQLE